MALLDDVKKTLSSGFELPKFGQSERIKQLQAATEGRKLLGGAAGPKQGSQAEIMAAAAARQVQAEDVAQGQLVAAELEQRQREQQQQFEQKQAFIDEDELNVMQQMQNKTQNILQEFYERRDELVFREDSAKVQYALMSMRLSNEDYLDRLEAEASRSRLDDAVAFEWELTQSVLRDEMDMFKRDISFRQAMGADDRTFKEYMAMFSLEQSLELANIDIEAAETTAYYQAIGEATSAAAQGLAEYGKMKGKSTPSTPQGGASSRYNLGISEPTPSPSSRYSLGISEPTTSPSSKFNLGINSSIDSFDLED